MIAKFAGNKPFYQGLLVKDLTILLPKLFAFKLTQLIFENLTKTVSGLGKNSISIAETY